MFSTMNTSGLFSGSQEVTLNGDRFELAIDHTFPDLNLLNGYIANNAACGELDQLGPRIVLVPPGFEQINTVTSELIRCSLAVHRCAVIDGTTVILSEALILAIQSCLNAGTFTLCGNLHCANIWNRRDWAQFCQQHMPHFDYYTDRTLSALSTPK